MVLISNTGTSAPFQACSPVCNFLKTCTVFMENETHGYPVDHPRFACLRFPKAHIIMFKCISIIMCTVGRTLALRARDRGFKHRTAHKVQLVGHSLHTREIVGLTPHFQNTLKSQIRVLYKFFKIITDFSVIFQIYSMFTPSASVV